MFAELKSKWYSYKSAKAAAYDAVLNERFDNLPDSYKENVRYYVNNGIMDIESAIGMVESLVKHSRNRYVPTWLNK